jgi:drug/metabolite transporter (DMT)-like permease
MLILKRLSVWVTETVLQVLLFAVLLIALFGYDPHAFGKGLLTYAVSVFTMFFSTGYLFTTAISRAVWRGRKLWPYSAFAATLFLIHFEGFNILIGGAFEPRDRVRIRLAGSCIAFLSTFLGSLALRKCPPTNGKPVEPMR